MKEGWDYKTIGEVIDHLRTGLNPRTHFKLNTPDAEGYYITVRELKGFAIEPDEKTDKVNRAAIKRINERSNLKIGDVLFSGTGTIGKTALVSELPVNWNIKEGVYAMTPKHSELNSKYFIYYIGSDLFLRLVNDKAAGTGVRSIPMKELVKLPISIPSLSEQQSIVDYLDSAFAKIDAMKANAEKALNEAKALFQASLKEKLEPKEGWKEKKLKEVVASITDGDHQPPPKSDDGIPFITISNIDKNSNKIVFGETFYVPNSYYCALKKERIPQQGDVLYTVTGSFGIPVLIDFQKDFCFQRHIALIRPKMGVLSPTYLFYWILSSYATSQAENTATGAAQRTVSLNSLRNFTIHIPTFSTQQSIVATLDSLKSKVDKLQENYDKISQECDALKQAILRQVFE